MFGNVNKIFLKSLLLLFVHSEGVKENFKASIHIYVYVAVKGVVFFLWYRIFAYKVGQN